MTDKTESKMKNHLDKFLGGLFGGGHGHDPDPDDPPKDDKDKDKQLIK